MSNFNETKSMSNIVIDEGLKRRIFSKYREAIENGNATTGESPATEKTTFIHVAPPTQKKGFTTQGKIIVGLVSVTLLIQCFGLWSSWSTNSDIENVKFQLSSLINTNRESIKAVEGLKDRLVLEMNKIKQDQVDSKKSLMILESLKTHVNEQNNKLAIFEQTLDKQLNSISSSGNSNFVRIIDAAEKLTNEASIAKDLIEEIRDTYRLVIEKRCQSKMSSMLTKVIANMDVDEHPRANDLVPLMN